jgi:hypothetical protein
MGNRWSQEVRAGNVRAQNEEDPSKRWRGSLGFRPARPGEQNGLAEGMNLAALLQGAEVFLCLLKLPSRLGRPLHGLGPVPPALAGVAASIARCIVRLGSLDFVPMWEPAAQRGQARRRAG